MRAETLARDQHPVSETRRGAGSAGPELPASRRRFWRDRTVRRWLVAWVGAPVLAIVNGAVREFAYKDQVGESAANQISVAPLITLLGLYFWILQRRWPLATTRDALSVGAVWVTLSVLFEFGFGHYVEGDSGQTCSRPTTWQRETSGSLSCSGSRSAPRSFGRSPPSDRRSYPRRSGAVYVVRSGPIGRHTDDAQTRVHKSGGVRERRRHGCALTSEADA